MIAELIKDMSKYLPASVVPGIAGMVAIPIVTRLFGPVEYGNYALVLATVSVFCTIVGWLPMSVVRFFPAYERDSRLGEFYGTVLKLAALSIAILLLIFLGLLSLCRKLLSENLYPLMGIGALVFVTTVFYEVLENFLRVKRRVGWYSAFFVWKSTASLGIGLALVLIFNLGIEGLLWGILLSTALVLPFLWRIAVDKSITEVSGFSTGLALSMGKYGFPLVAGNLGAFILSLSDRYILEVFRGTYEVGIYSVSYDICAKSIMLLVSLFALAAGPIGMNVWERDGEKASQTFVSKLTRTYILICIPAVVGLSALANPIMRILAAREYFEGYRVIPLVTAGVFFLGLQQRYQTGLLFHKRSSFIMFGILASGLLNLGLNFLLVPSYGYMAAAVTTLVSYCFLFASMVIASRRVFAWEFPFRTLGRVVLASSIMGLAVHYVGNSITSSTLANLVIGTSIGILIYFLILFLSGEFSKEETRRFSLLCFNLLRRKAFI